MIILVTEAGDTLNPIVENLQLSKQSEQFFDYSDTSEATLLFHEQNDYEYLLGFSNKSEIPINLIYENRKIVGKLSVNGEQNIENKTFRLKWRAFDTVSDIKAKMKEEVNILDVSPTVTSDVSYGFKYIVLPNTPEGHSSIIPDFLEETDPLYSIVRIWRQNDLYVVVDNVPIALLRRSVFFFYESAFVRKTENHTPPDDSGTWTFIETAGVSDIFARPPQNINYTETSEGGLYYKYVNNISLQLTQTVVNGRRLYDVLNYFIPMPSQSTFNAFFSSIRLNNLVLFPLAECLLTNGLPPSNRQRVLDLTLEKLLLFLTDYLGIKFYIEPSGSGFVCKPYDILSKQIFPTDNDTLSGLLGSPIDFSSAPNIRFVNANTNGENVDFKGVQAVSTSNSSNESSDYSCEFYTDIEAIFEKSDDYPKDDSSIVILNCAGTGAQTETIQGTGIISGSTLANIDLAVSSVWANRPFGFPNKNMNINKLDVVLQWFSLTPQGTAKVTVAGDKLDSFDFKQVFQSNNLFFEPKTITFEPFKNLSTIEFNVYK